LSATDWRNWLGHQSFRPTDMLRPADERDAAAALALAARRDLPVRAFGGGHSFSPIVATSGMLIDTSGLSGMVWLDPARRRARVRAGTTIRALAIALDEAGMALANQGYIGAQTLSGDRPIGG
jgi:FAD/FMN-containing dehydrogenase